MSITSESPRHFDAQQPRAMRFSLACFSSWRRLESLCRKNKPKQLAQIRATRGRRKASSTATCTQTAKSAKSATVCFGGVALLGQIPRSPDTQMTTSHNWSSEAPQPTVARHERSAPTQPERCARRAETSARVTSRDETETRSRGAGHGGCRAMSCTRCPHSVTKRILSQTFRIVYLRPFLSRPVERKKIMSVRPSPHTRA